ncbi:Lrp/AsnC ligand binding domain-containing protein [Porticoccus sp. W117]|uniref:Lrp/AsnC ligand binding domain-containing protein n=1 Tax=Porticoccus sp. W117 TaxID=3054777 RepID=UPI002592BC5B|nr:Lrp/AsnC ligand binding domain-containing protein [Porticoccus sp. W117]MDM3872467.1 Lrp/AsnC ligand binding domain-containing protein [Porticoccus sp. W117]
MAKKNKPLDRVDLQILAILQKNGKISNVELAEQVHLTPPPCLERVKRLEREGYIKNYACLLDPYKLQAGLLAFIQVSLQSTTTENLSNFNRAIREIDEVQECHMMSGGFDYLLKIRTADMQSYRRFLGEQLANIPNVRETHTFVSMQEVKSQTSIPLPKA